MLFIDYYQMIMVYAFDYLLYPYSDKCTITYTFVICEMVDYQTFVFVV